MEFAAVWQLVAVFARAGDMPAQDDCRIKVREHAQRGIAIGIGHVGVVDR
jgi:hypothetical protein